MTTVPEQGDWEVGYFDCIENRWRAETWPSEREARERFVALCRSAFAINVRMRRS